jgi:hypothetical protein
MLDQRVVGVRPAGDRPGHGTEFDQRGCHAALGWPVQTERDEGVVDWAGRVLARAQRAGRADRRAAPRPVRIAGRCPDGLVYSGVGWVVWRDADALPDDLVFKVNYLGEQMRSTSPAPDRR